MGHDCVKMTGYIEFSLKTLAYENRKWLDPGCKEQSTQMASRYAFATVTTSTYEYLSLWCKRKIKGIMDQDFLISI